MLKQLSEHQESHGDIHMGPQGVEYHLHEVVGVQLALEFQHQNLQ